MRAFNFKGVMFLICSDDQSLWECYYFFSSRLFSGTKTRIVSVDIYKINENQNTRKCTHIHTHASMGYPTHRETLIMSGQRAKRLARKKTVGEGRQRAHQVVSPAMVWGQKRHTSPLPGVGLLSHLGTVSLQV